MRRSTVNESHEPGALEGNASNTRQARVARWRKGPMTLVKRGISFGDFLQREAARKKMEAEEVPADRSMRIILEYF